MTDHQLRCFRHSASVTHVSPPSAPCSLSVQMLLIEKRRGFILTSPPCREQNRLTVLNGQKYTPTGLHRFDSCNKPFLYCNIWVKLGNVPLLFKKRDATVCPLICFIINSRCFFILYSVAKKHSTNTSVYIIQWSGSLRTFLSTVPSGGRSVSSRPDCPVLSIYVPRSVRRAGTAGPQSGSDSHVSICIPCHIPTPSSIW